MFLTMVQTQQCHKHCPPQILFIAEPKGEASNRDALLFCVGMYVCMYIRRLGNATLCLCMYIRNACAIQSYARVCISVTLGQLLRNSVAKMCPEDDYGLGILPGLCDSYLGRTQPQVFQVPAPLTAHRVQFQ